MPFPDRMSRKELDDGVDTCDAWAVLASLGAAPGGVVFSRNWLHAALKERVENQRCICANAQPDTHRNMAAYLCEPATVERSSAVC